MPPPSHRPPLQRSLFEQATPPLPSGLPPLTALPEGTRAALRQLVTRMLIAHARGGAAERESNDERG